MAHQPAVILFECQCDKTVVGQQVYVLGSCGEFGCWKIPRAVPLSTTASQYPKWISRPFEMTECSCGDKIEFKFLIKGASDSYVQWEDGPNRIIRCPEAGQLARVKGVFGQTPAVSVHVTTNQAVARPLEAEVPPPEVTICQDLRNVSYTCPVEAITQTNDFRGSDVVSLILKKHAQTKSLRERIEIVSDTVTACCSSSASVVIKTLAYISLYWEWIATRVIHCEEDGRHFRPNHIAYCAREIFETVERYLLRLKKDLCDTKSHDWNGDVAELISRRLVKFLPSFDSSFTATVPMTRIRDIAHRNDIPSEVKNEIKHRLQNKLHRCASPEDLMVCREMLNRFQSMNLSPDFIHQFTIFEKELSHFFNMQSPLERLTKLRDELPEFADLIREYLNKLTSVEYNICEGQYGYRVESVLARFADAVSSAIPLRNKLAVYIPKSLTNDGEGKDMSRSQLARLCDIDIEDCFISVVSRVANISERSEDIDQQAMVKMLIKVLMYLLQHLALSGFASALCLLLSHECSSILEVADRHLYKICESMGSRIARLCGTFADLLSAAYDCDNIEELIRSLKIKSATAHMAAESIIRSSFLFQVSRVATALVRLTRSSNFSIISGSEQAFSGQLFRFKAFTDIDFSRESTHEFPIILALDYVEGDEDVDTLEAQVAEKSGVSIALAGILTKNEIPLLSHLGVRVRQRRLPFVCMSSNFPWDECIAALNGSTVSVQPTADNPNPVQKVSPQNVRRPAAPPAPAAPPPPHPSGPEDYQIVKSPTFEILAANADVNRCGKKAATCLKLHDTLSHTDLKAPPCIALPFGCLDSALKWPINSAARITFDNLKANLQDSLIAPNGQKSLKEGICDDLQRCILSLSLSREIVCKLRDAVTFSFISSDMRVLESQRLALYVRSSSSAEDTAGEAAAGVFESQIAVVTWDLVTNRNRNQVTTATVATALAAGGTPLDNRRSESSQANGRMATNGGQEKPEDGDESLPQTAAGDSQVSGHQAFTQSLDIRDLWNAIKHVWASLYSSRAVLARAGKEADMGVLIQPVVNAKWSFYAYTRAPASVPEGLYIELAKGLGEALAKGGKGLGGGTATRLSISNKFGVVLLSFWSMWGALAPKMMTPCFDSLTAEELTQAYWNKIANKICHIRQLQILFGQPQDVEGCIVQGPGDTIDIFIVQSRPQTD